MLLVKSLPPHIITFIFQEYLTLCDLIIVCQSIRSSEKENLMNNLRSSNFSVNSIPRANSSYLYQISWIVCNGFGLKNLTIPFPIERVDKGTIQVPHDENHAFFIPVNLLRGLMEKPCLYHLSIVPSMSKINHKQIVGKVATNVLLSWMRLYGGKLQSLSLSLYHNALTEQDFIELVTFCPNLKHITIISPYDCLTAKSLSHIVEILGHSLTSLCIRQSIHLNATHIALIFPYCSRLTSLTMFNCHSDEICPQSRGLGINSILSNRLQHLDLSFSQCPQLSADAESHQANQHVAHAIVQSLLMGNLETTYNYQTSCSHSVSSLLYSLALKGWTLSTKLALTLCQTLRCSLRHLDLSQKSDHFLCREIIDILFSSKECGLSSLSSLRLSVDGSMGEREIQLLTKCLHKLQDLEIDSLLTISDHWITMLIDGNPMLNSIKLRGCSNLSTWNCFRSVNSLLHSLTLHDCHTFRELHGPIPSLSQLRILDLQGCINLTSKGLVDLTFNCCMLEHINLSGCHFITDDAVFPTIQRCSKTIKHLSLRKIAKLTDETITWMAENCQALEYFDIAHVSGFNLTILHSLSKCKKLHEICIEGNTILGKERTNFMQGFKKHIIVTGSK